MSSKGPSLDDPKTAIRLAKTYMEALRHAPLPVIEHDGDLRITGWNDAAERVFGFTREESVGRSVPDLILGGGDDEGWRRLSREGGEAVLDSARKDGSSVRCRWRHEPIRDEQGEPVGAICFGQDVAMERCSVELRRKERLLRLITDSLPIGTWGVDAQGTFVLHEGMGLAAAGLTEGQFLGMSIFEVYKDDPDSLGPIRETLEGEVTHGFSETHGLVWERWATPVHDERGEFSGAVGFTLDISQTTKVERELRAQLDIVRRQQRVIRDLSTPIIEVWSRVLTLPMVGMVDSARTAEVMDSLLEAVVRTGARFAILDLTGVEAVDTQTAAYLIELVRAVRLLGAEGIITGIRPTVAQTIVALGLDLAGIITLSNLRAGLRHCIVQMNRERSPVAPSGAGAPARDKPPPVKA